MLRSQGLDIPIRFDDNQASLNRLERNLQDLDPSQQQECRICLQMDSQLLSVCSCRGTVGFIHQNCLKEWITHKIKQAQPIQCQICHQKYLYSQRINRSCEVSNFTSHFNKSKVQIVITVAILVVLLGANIYFCLLLTQPAGENSLPSLLVSQYLKLVYTCLMIGCFTFIAIAIILFVNKYFAGKRIEIEIITGKLNNYHTIKIAFEYNNMGELFRSQ